MTDRLSEIELISKRAHAVAENRMIYSASARLVAAESVAMADRIRNALAYIDSRLPAANSELIYHLQRIKGILAGDDDGKAANGETQ